METGVYRYHLAKCTKRPLNLLLYSTHWPEAKAMMCREGVIFRPSAYDTPQKIPPVVRFTALSEIPVIDVFGPFSFAISRKLY